ncbi:MAG: penicillin-binding protein, partial [Bacteroidota bacterium]|nr:penicillin-binding protein [Bacteroidota bacterium]
ARAKVRADTTLGISQNAKFIQPENMRQDRMFDYQNLIDKTAPPGAEGANEGNGRANQYLDTSAPTVPLDSKLSPDEQKVLKEANLQKTDKQGSVRITVTDADKRQEPPKKKGFFKRLFGTKDH